MGPCSQGGEYGGTRSRCLRRWGPHRERQRLTGTAPAVLIQPEAGLAGALEGARQVGAMVLTAAAAGCTFVHVCRQTRGCWGLFPGGRGRGALPPRLCPLD